MIKGERISLYFTYESFLITVLILLKKFKSSISGNFCSKVYVEGLAMVIIELLEHMGRAFLNASIISRKDCRIIKAAPPLRSRCLANVYVLSK
jgi:hypothetical protein